MQMTKLAGVQNSTVVQLGNQNNSVFEFVRQGSMVCDKGGAIWIQDHLLPKLKILTKGIDTKAAVTHELTVTAVGGKAAVVIMSPPCAGELSINDEVKVFTADNAEALYVFKEAGKYEVVFTPTDKTMAAVTTSVTIT